MPLGLTLIEAQNYARRAEQLAVLKTFAEGELLRRLPFRNLVGGSLSFPAETKLLRVGFRAVNEGYRQSYGVINSDSEFVHLFGGDLDVDPSKPFAPALTRPGVAVRGKPEAFKMKAVEAWAGPLKAGVASAPSG